MSDLSSQFTAAGEPLLSPCEPTPWFKNVRGQAVSHSSNALRGRGVPDVRSIASVLQFGAIIPPLSPWEGVERILPGRQGLQPLDKDWHGQNSILPDASAKPTHTQRVSLLEYAVDRVLQERLGNGRDPVVLFSGGVDSGFLASRLAAMGRRDSLLVNFSFGTDDQESLLAEAMAQELGLPFKRVTVARPLCACLQQPGQEYPQPFGDHSTVPTSDLAYAVMSQVDLDSRLILDGTGADGAFGLQASLGKWAKSAQLPRWIRKLIAASYQTGFYARDDQLEKVARIVRRYERLGPVGAIVGQNPLDGILYQQGHRTALIDLLMKWLQVWAGRDRVRQMVGADLALTCANVFAQKANSLYQRHGHRIVYPFLEDEVVHLALNVLDTWGRYPAKQPLKESLSKYVPREMVYRPKSGFVDPRGSVFREAEFIEHLQACAEDGAPVADVVNRKAVRTLSRYLRSGKKLPAQTMNFIWAVVFTDRWYRTAPSSPQGK